VVARALCIWTTELKDFEEEYNKQKSSAFEENTKRLHSVVKDFKRMKD